MKYLGCINNWVKKVYKHHPVYGRVTEIVQDEEQYPEELKKCMSLGHVTTYKKSTLWACYGNDVCEICGISWSVDSSG